MISNTASQIILLFCIVILLIFNVYQYVITISQMASLTQLEDYFKQLKAEFSQIQLENKEQSREIEFLQLETQQCRNELNETNEILKTITTSTNIKIDKSFAFGVSKDKAFHTHKKSKRPDRLIPLSLPRGKKMNNILNTSIVPSSCNDLNDYGHTLNGIYLIAGNKYKNTRHIDVVFCDFQPSETEPNHIADSQLGEKRLGYLNVNKSSSSVYFYVSRLGKPPTFKDGIVRFEKVHLNIGGGFNMQTGVFKAPKAGIYHFSFSCLKDGYSLESFFIYLRVNNVSSAFSGVGAGLSIAPATLQIMQKLKKGDRVSLFKSNGVFGGSDTFVPSHHFTGLLLEEYFEE